MMIQYFLTLLLLPYVVNSEPGPLIIAERGEYGVGSVELGGSCYHHVDCVTGYCSGTWISGTCATPAADGENAEINLIQKSVPESCASGRYVCGICGTVVKIGQLCDWTQSCEAGSLCTTTVGGSCTGKCQACPPKCGKNSEPEGCHHHPITKTVQCGRMTLSEKWEDLGQEMASGLLAVAECISDVTGLKMPALDESKYKDEKGATTTTTTTSAAKGTCAALDRNTGGTCRIYNCDKWRAPTYCDGGVCMCKQGYFAEEKTVDGKKVKICKRCPKDLPKGDNNGEECSEDADCTSGFCSGQMGGATNKLGINAGECVPATACYGHIRTEINGCTNEKCDITIGKECLAFNKKFATNKKGNVDTKAMTDKLAQIPNLKSKIAITWQATGSVQLSGYGEAQMKYKDKVFTARLRDTKINLKASLEFGVQAQFNYVIPETKISLAPSQVIFMGAFMAGPVPIFVNIWAQPVAYYSFNGVLKADAKVKLDFTGNIWFKEDLEIMLDIAAQEAVKKKGFALSNVQHEKEVKQFWEMNGSASMNLKAKVAVIFSISVEGFQFQIIPGLAGTLMVAADANSQNNKACEGKGGASVQAEASLVAYLTGRLDFNPLSVNNKRRSLLGAKKVTDTGKKEVAKVQKKAASQITALEKKGYVPPFLAKDAKEAVKMDPGKMIEEMKKMDADEVKNAVSDRITTINVVDIIVSGCNIFFDLFDKYLGSKYDSCKEVAHWKDTICKGIKKVAKFFQLDKPIPVAANLIKLTFEWTIAYKKLPATCAISWDAAKVDEKISQVTGGVVKPNRAEQESFVATGKGDTIFPVQIGEIVASCIIFFLLISWFVYGKFQEGDNFVSYVALLDEVAVSTQESLI